MYLLKTELETKGFLAITAYVEMHTRLVDTIIILSF